MAQNKKFITAALPYVNNQPHLGNIIGSVLGSDAYNRFCKKFGFDTVFVCGTDEYGTATEMEAMKQGVHPSEIVAKNRVLHKAVYDWMGIDFDIFGQTSCDEHTKIVQDMFKRCYENGYFEKQEIEQYFCESCSQFLADRFVEGECTFCDYNEARGDQCDKCGKCLKVQELRNPKCKICTKTPEMKKTNHLFLRLDLLQKKIIEEMDKKISNWSENAKNIYTEWLEKDLTSRCMTRSLKYSWGVPVPLEGFEDKVFYVWFDAVIGYLTFLAQIKPDWREWLQNAQFVQFMGKDNVFFHSFIFPAILIAANNNIPTVDIISSTEYLTFNGEKFSKSRNIGIFGMDLVSKDIGPQCAWRFALLKKRPETKDSDFKIDEFISLYNSDLRSNLGNLCQRVLSYIKNRCGGQVQVNSLDDDDKSFVSDMNSLYLQYLDHMNKISLREALTVAVEISSRANRYVQSLQSDKQKLSNGFQIAYSAVVFLGHIFEPFIPLTSQKIFKMCNTSTSGYPKSFEIIRSGSISSEISILFSPLTDVQVNNLKQYIPENKN